MQLKESKTSFHFWTSMFKSAIRIVACYTLFKGQIATASILLIIAEIIGVIEEI